MDGRTIRKLRDAAGMSQIELESQSGVHRVVLSYVENGHRRLSPEQQEVVLRVLTRAIKARSKDQAALLSEVREVRVGV